MQGKTIRVAFYHPSFMPVSNRQSFCDRHLCVSLMKSVRCLGNKKPGSTLSFAASSGNALPPVLGWVHSGEKSSSRLVIVLKNGIFNFFIIIPEC